MVKNFLLMALTMLFAWFFAQLFLGKPMVLAGLLFFSGALFLSVYRPLWFVIFLVVIQERLFQSVDFGIQIYLYNDLVIVLLGAALVLQFLLKGWPKDLHKNFYFWSIMALLGIIVFSIFFGAGVVHNQPVGSLVFRGRPFFLYLIFVYLYQVKLSARHVKEFTRFLVWSGFIVAALVIVEVHVFKGNTLFQLAWVNGVSGFREGRVRVFTYSIGMGTAYYYLLSMMYYEPKHWKKLMYGVMWGVIVYQYVFCSMTRSSLVVLGVATLLFILTRSHRFKFQAAGVGVVALTVFMLLSPAGSGKFGLLYDLVTLTRNEAKSRSSGSGNIAVRRRAIEFYYPYFEKTGFLGMGVMSTTYAGSPAYQGGHRGYTFSDIGFFSSFFRFGVPALLIFVVVMIRQIKDLLAILKSKDYEIRAIAMGRLLPTVTGIIFLPLNSLLLFETGALYVGIGFYVVHQLRASLSQASPVSSVLRPVRAVEGRVLQAEASA